MRFVIISAVIIGGVYLVSRFYERTYSQPQQSATVAPRETKPGAPKKLGLQCAIVISDADKRRGLEIRTRSGKALSLSAGGPMTLLRPIGQMVADTLPVCAGCYFEGVQLVTSAHRAENADLILRPCCWTFGDDTAFDFKGLPLLIGTGSAWTEVSMRLAVEGTGIERFSETESSCKTTVRYSLQLFPYPRIRKTMTEATEAAVAVVCRKIMERIAKDPRVLQVSSQRQAASDVDHAVIRERQTLAPQATRTP